MSTTKKESAKKPAAPPRDNQLVMPSLTGNRQPGHFAWRSAGNAIRLLFVCTGNSARSQMAEGWARALAAECGPVMRSPAECSPAKRDLVGCDPVERSPALRVASAGTTPAGVHSLAVEAMAEAGIDISAQRSQSIEAVDWRSADVAVTLCGGAREACTALAWPARCRREHWPLADPAAAPAAGQPAAFRAARDELRERVAGLLAELERVATTIDG